MSSRTIVNAIAAELRAFAPFSDFGVAQLQEFANKLTVVYLAAGEIVIEPSTEPPQYTYIVKSGRILGDRPGISGEAVTALELSAGELFPIGAVLTDRPVHSTFRAAVDSFCYRMPAAAFKAQVSKSPLLQDFAERRLFNLLERSRAVLNAAYAAEHLSEHPFSQPLSSLIGRMPITCPVDSSIEDALRLMHTHKVGAVVLVDASDHASGILTERDVIGRITLPQRPLASPVALVASSPVLALDEQTSLSVAALTMVERNIRHIVITRADRVVGVISERSLFALQRKTLAGISDALVNAPDLAGLVQAARDIRALSRSLVAQGVAAGLLTQFISRLNDQLTQRLIALEAQQQQLANISGLRWCWLAFGSEGRHEQTISTDQDNGIIFALDETANDQQHATAKEQLLSFAQRVNHALAQCGFPLCKGNIMASNPELTATQSQWVQRFEHWIDAGDPKSLLDANIFFDFRPLAGDTGLAAKLSEAVFPRARMNPRFRKQMADNALANRPPLNWLGRIATRTDADEGSLDLKRYGAMPFTDGARLLALASGVTVTRSADRLRAAGEILNIPANEIHTWIESFEFIQMLRLRHQHARLLAAERSLAVAENPNLLRLDSLSELDLRILKEVFRQARKLQQRIELDYAG